jgi:hypothetical protein
MKDKILKILKEDFDWAVKDTVPFLEIGEPLQHQQPKNKYRLHLTHGVGEDRGTWVPNWINFDPNTQLDELVRYIKIVSWLQNNQSSGIWGLAGLWTDNRETWVLSDEDNRNIKKTMEEEEWDLEEDRDVIVDTIWEWLNDELTDYGIREYDSYYQDDASIEDWKVTYFDEFGVEHSVKVNLPK